MSVQSSDEITSWLAPNGSGSGCVSHMSHFTLASKATGAETKSTSLILSYVQVRDGKKMLVELTEVMN